jgi:gamma-glutamyltranspeptidase/glutathione hydrolase
MFESLSNTFFRNAFRTARVLVHGVQLVASLGSVLALAQPKPEPSPPVPKARPQTRSMVMTRFGIVATSQTLASQAGAQILELGGNAVDAAIAANAVLGLVEPTSNGLGGDLFAIVYEAKTGKLYGLNASGWAPAKLTIDYVRSQGHQTMPQRGILTVTVPGCVAGWELLRKKFGTKDFQALLRPAIYYAEEGFPVTELISDGWHATERAIDEGRIEANAAFKQTFLPGGHAPAAGEIFRNPDLARSLRQITSRGRDGFYKGSTAAALVRLSHEVGGAIEEDDLAQFQAEWVEPISTTYRGWTVTELPPNGQGIAALLMLNLMERFPLRDYGQASAKALHVMIEAKKLAYADLMRYVADPHFAKVPVEGLLSKKLAQKRASEIVADRVLASATPSAAEDIQSKPGADTIYMSAIDKEGNIVSLIQSNYSGFGSGLVAPGTGFGLQNRGALFSLDPKHPNALEPRKRPLHTIIPAFLQKGDVRIGFGIMGGWNQAQAHAQFVSNVVDFQMNIQAALEAPRFTKQTFEGVDVTMESRIPEATRAELTRLGHKITLLPPYSGEVGGGQAVMRDGREVNFGASDPRKDGAAIPQAAPASKPVPRNGKQTKTVNR